MERRPYQRYEESYKLEVVNYYYEHGGDRKETLEKYRIDHSSLRDWLHATQTKKKLYLCLMKYNVIWQRAISNYPRMLKPRRLNMSVCRKN